MSAIFTVILQGVVEGPEKIARVIVENEKGEVLMEQGPDRGQQGGADTPGRQFVIHGDQTVLIRLDETRLKP